MRHDDIIGCSNGEEKANQQDRNESHNALVQATVRYLLRWGIVRIYRSQSPHA